MNKEKYNFVLTLRSFLLQRNVINAWNIFFLNNSDIDAIKSESA